MRLSKYILCMMALLVSVTMRGQYNPTNPAEPGAPETTYRLTLSADPSGGGSFNQNATTSHVAGTTVSLRAYAASNFSFVSWEEDGVVISTSANFSYTMPAHDVSLIAHYNYTPSSPTEPSEPDIPAKPVYSNIYLTASPSGGGSFNISSGTSYEVGTSVRVQASAASNFTFVNWTQDGEVIAESRTFNYVIREGIDANRLTAHFTYTPGSPGEPAEPEARKVYHRVYLESDPVGGGYFNTESGNQYEEGTVQTFRAYNNEWYTFQNWTIDGVVVSTGSTCQLTIPDRDVTLTAHYTYNYNPGNPGEPGQAVEKHLSIYGMTSVGVAGGSVIYPVFLENTEDVYGVTVVMKFPEGFTPNVSNVMTAERAAAHSMTVEAIGDNAYRFDLTGTTALTGSNGQIFQVPVAIGTDVATDQSYQVLLSNGARLNSDGSKEVIGARSGYIFVEQMKEDGLYAQFSYEKLQGRVKFTNLSSDRAVSYLWDFGDGTTSTERDPLHIYAASGYYDVKLTVKGQTGTDEALMTVLINDESTWQVDGVFFLDTEVRGVRYFTAAADLLSFMSAHPIAGSLRLMVQAGEDFGCPLTDAEVSRLTTIQSQLTEKGFILEIKKNGDGGVPVLNFGSAGTAVNADVVSLFVAIGKNLVCSDVNLRLWDIGFNPSPLDQLSAQTVLSGQPTAEVDFTQVSTDLVFSWTATTDTETATGYPAEGTGNIPVMTAVSGSAADAHLIYNIEATYQGTQFFNHTHTITLKPALEGQFTDLQPADGARLETTTVTLSWNKINNAVYDVYLWNVANQRPATPVAEGIEELSYTSRNFCQNDKSYKWQVVARNDVQQMASDTMHFAVKMLPDLHIINLRTSGELTAGKTVTVEWTVRNDGDGSTRETAWTDRLWLMPDVYGGTSQTSCKLLAETPNVRSLASGQEYTASTEVTLDEQTWGSFYLLVAADMNSVTNIEWSTAGGSIVNPYQPATGDEGYDYLFATTKADGNLLEEHGETATRSDNFFYLKTDIAAPVVNEADWAVLTAAYEAMGNGEGWTRTWNLNAETRSLAGLNGVRLSGGRVVSIDLSSNGLTGGFPYTLLQLPALQTLNLSGNNLTGDLGEATSHFSSLTSHPSSLTTLNISNNQLSGNIGLFANFLPALTSLDASKNCLDAVYPMISEKVTSLNLKGQTISTVTPLHLAHIDEQTLMQVPSILLYDHESQTFRTDLRIRLEEPLHEWSVIMAYEDGALSVPYVSEQNTYYGENGDVLRVKVVDKANRDTGDSFSISLSFDDGDANFNGEVNILDVQATINYIFESYQKLPFNFTAANLNIPRDQVVNVQDVVGMVNLLLTSTPPADGEGLRSIRVKHSDKVGGSASDGKLCINDGQLILESSIPVAAFDIVLDGCQALTMASSLPAGITCTTLRQNGCVRVIGYSLSGTTLPLGQTILCETMPDGAAVVYAKLADADANEITVSIGDGSATGIQTIDNLQLTIDNVYDLSGRKIVNGKSVNGKLQKGLYIVNGKKIINKK